MSTTTEKPKTSTITCETKLFKIGDWTIAHLPKEASTQLPSRGIVMVKGEINDTSFEAVLEPDGWGSHWLAVDDRLQKLAGVTEGDTVTLALQSTKEWIEPEVPKDIVDALKSNAAANETW